MPSKSLPELDEQRRTVTTNAAVALDAAVAARAIERAIADPTHIFSRRAVRATRNVLAVVSSLTHLEGEELESVVNGASDFTMKLPPATNVARAASRTRDTGSREEISARISELVAESRAIECVGDSVRIADKPGAQEFVRFLRELSSDGVSQAIAADTGRYSAYAVG